MANKLVEGSAAEEKTETPAFEKKEDAGKKSPMKKGKVSASAARRLAEMLKGGKKTMVAPKSAPVVDAEDLADGGIDEAKEKE